MGWESPSHWVIIALVVLVLFGYKKLPEMSRSVGRSLRIFKTEIKGMGQDDAARDSAETVTPGTDQPSALTPPVVTPPAVTSPVVAPPVVAPPVVTPPPAATAVNPTVTTPPTAEETPQQRTQTG
ncbi:Sec-independent protein translocase subunit TatA [Jatrophihabitans sp.]|jgi:sec-independent protein translocase protein TatA|uniref:Sec-independent protein translocase subunit TatA n=1 Tax=Jatrophihabitans sp. TaxID=1932789 RepID=UPI002F05D80F